MARALRTDAGANGGLPVPWSIEDSAGLYRIAQWGPPYFFIDSRGHVAVRTTAGTPHSMGLPAIVREARDRQVGFPLLIRFPDILRAQVERLHGEFSAALARTGYGNGHLSVYPIKVNPLQHVVEEILGAGRRYGMGLECGSRPELAVALPYLRDTHRLLVCNGVKDDAMLELLIDAQRLGRNVIPVVQSLEEFAALRSMADNRRVSPVLGVRMRPAGAAAAPGGRCAGSDSKFGLSAAELLTLLEQPADSLRQLRLLHVHPGSQVTDLGELQVTVREAAQVYAALVRGGAGLKYLDVGGGLGVNYGDAEGESNPALNYTMAEYAETVAATVGAVCRTRRVPAPMLVTETGRALTAHHAVLIVPVLAVRDRPGLTPGARLASHADEATAALVSLARSAPILSGCSDALALLDEAQGRYAELGESFGEGRIPMQEYALAERAYVSVCRHLIEALRDAGLDPPRRVKVLEHALADRILCDFSVFQSLPDHWATGQAFPVMPIQRLGERPSARGVLVDLTCDSDGRVTRYVSSESNRSILPVHAPLAGVQSCLAFFLVGAYEDVIGDTHNLFGRVAEVHVRTNDQAVGTHRFDRIIPAAPVAEVLAQMHYGADELQASMVAPAASGIAAADAPPQVIRRLADRYTALLHRGTYHDTRSGEGSKT